MEMKRKKNKPQSQPNEIERSLWLRDVKFDNLIDAVLAMKDDKAWMPIFRDVLVRLLSEYASIAEVRPKRQSQDIMSSFRRQSSKTQVLVKEDVDQSVTEMLDLIKDSQNKESFFRPIVSRFVCMYAVFATSDKEGAKKCEILAKDLLRSKNNTPEKLVLSVLKKRALRIGEKIPTDERELILRYRNWERRKNLFWIKNGAKNLRLPFLFIILY